MTTDKSKKLPLNRHDLEKFAREEVAHTPQMWVPLCPSLQQDWAERHDEHQFMCWMRGLRQSDTTDENDR